MSPLQNNSGNKQAQEGLLNMRPKGSLQIELAGSRDLPAQFGLHPETKFTQESTLALEYI